MTTRAPVVVSCGEPAGVGLEIAHKAFEALRGEVPMVLLADRRHVSGPVVEVASVGDVTGDEAALPLLHHRFAGDAVAGQPDPRNAQGVIDVIAHGVDLVTSGAASALCTLPIHKKALKDGADFAYPGHTEYLAALAGVERVVMMLACPELRVVPVTIHIGLADVPGALTPALLEDTLRITEAALKRDFGIAEPRLAVAGLNPHAGEGGAMGTEEITMIAPLLERLSESGMRLSGPMSADTMFHAQARAGYDAAVCMYHDQALIPIKTIDFAGGVNVTLGLPFIRTSPDHGTAFDIAGKGVADPTSTIAALRMAWDMAGKRG
ncbi:4-hydroxythreonine-4-phosphate dehydrogenase PdxA [Litoreibacter arenae]|uniref:4-hydroxythreonine-4-phosphate dehydrogenase n=1 Tax=Litoreibacter arenae DSM 19593 TaxID=1123360 RepID=S9RZ01_9RHOB|nr:4-hydroxythreonine-4-phosphate dehydrogenase PdxA [Litoreibacter arenae]EPX79199.1 4-hydroxythreonine-4-phosphate dehydrogenase [Litoreibacter arenae DSM 19593]